MQDLFANEAQTADRDRSLTTAIIDAALDAGYSIWIRDEHEDSQTYTTRNRDTLLAAVGTSRETTFTILDTRVDLGKGVGRITVYHGDEEDRITAAQAQQEKHVPFMDSLTAPTKEDAPTEAKKAPAPTGITRLTMDEAIERANPLLTKETAIAYKQQTTDHLLWIEQNVMIPAGVHSSICTRFGERVAEWIETQLERMETQYPDEPTEAKEASQPATVAEATPILDEIVEYSESLKEAPAPKRVGQFPVWIDPTEAAIINKLITAIKAENLLMRVYDGEAFATAWTSSRKTIQAMCAQTDYTVLHLKEEWDAPVGTVTLIHGNGEDVISDWSVPRDNPEAEMKLDAICEGASA